MGDGADPLVRMWLERPDGGAAAPVLVRTHDDGRVEVHGADGAATPALAPGTQVRLLRGVHDDAAYVTPVTVERVDPGGPAWLREAGERERLQQREHVRVATPPVDVRVTVVDEHDVVREVAGTLLDLSASGLRIGHEPPVLPCGARVTVDLLLPDDEHADVTLALTAEVRRAVEDADGDGLRSATALVLLDVPPPLEQRLVRWVFAVQAARRREGRGR